MKKIKGPPGLIPALVNLRTDDLEAELINALANLAVSYVEDLRAIALSGGPTDLEVTTITALAEQIQSAKERREGEV